MLKRIMKKMEVVKANLGVVISALKIRKTHS